MNIIHTMIPLALLATCFAGTVQATPKIYLNPSDQTGNWSPDNTYCEADNMNDVAHRLEAKLKARGFEVQNSDGGTMSEATTAANAWPADIYISLHSNAAAGPGWGKAHGTNTLFYLPKDGSGPNPISVKLAVLCDEKVVEKMTTYGHGHNFAVTADLPFLTYNLFVLRKTEMPGTLVEGLFHDNEEDTAVLKTVEGRDAYAQGVYEALCDYFGWSYYPDTPILDPVGPAANDSTGCLALVVRGEKGNAQVIRQTGINGAWSDKWTDLEGSISGKPFIARNAQGRLQIFAWGSGGHVLHKVQAKAGSDRWNGWYDLGGGDAGPSAVARNADGRLIVFAIGRDEHLKYRIQHSAGSALQWDDWVDLGGKMGGGASVCAQADGRLVLACSNNEGYLKWTVQVGDKWEKWHDVDNHESGAGRLAMDASGRLALFVEGVGNHVLCRMQSAPNASTWDAWQDLGGSCGLNLAISKSTDGRLELFGSSSEGKTAHNSQGADGKWTGWQALGDIYTVDPVVGRNLDGRIELFARDKDGKMQHRVQREPGKSAIWDGWYTVGETFKATVREYKTATPAQ